MWYVYVLRSKKDGRMYTGLTSDLKRRLSEHERGKTHSTKRMLPLELAFYEAFMSKEDATVQEKFYKSGYGKEVLAGKLENYLKSKGQVSI